MTRLRALQHQYTSCRFGLSGMSGYQTRAESSGLARPEREELVGRGSYQAPRGLPHAPDEHTIDAMFPVALRWFQLRSGRPAAVRAAYAGRDEQGRWGNHFAHSLVIERCTEGFWPIDLAGWGGWKSRLAPAEDVAPPAPLPIVDWECDEGKSIAGLVALREFLLQHPERPELLARLVQAIVDAESTGRNVLVRCTDAREAILWIACATKCFPAQVAREISFSSFQYDYRNPLLLNASCGETELKFDEGDRSFRFQLFDLVTGRHSEPTRKTGKFAAFSAGWLAGNLPQLQRFHRMAECFDLRKPGPELDQLVMLGVDGKGSPATWQARAEMQFVRARLRPERLGQMEPWFSSVLAQAAEGEDPESAAELVWLSLRSAVELRSEAAVRRVLDAWVSVFVPAVAKGAPLDSLHHLREEIERALSLEGRLMAEAFLDAAQQERLRASLQWADVPVVRRAYREVLKALQAAGRDPVAAPERRTLLEHVLRVHAEKAVDLAWSLAPFRERADELTAAVADTVALVHELAGLGTFGPRSVQEVTSSLAGSVASVLARCPAELRLETYARIGVRERGHFLLAMALNTALERSANRLGDMLEYETRVAPRVPGFHRTMFSWLAHHHYGRLSREEKVVQARRWLERDVRLESPLADDVHFELDRALPLDPQVDAQPLESLLQRASVDFPGSRLALRRAIAYARLHPRGALDDLHSAFSSIEESDYDEALLHVLPGLLSAIEAPDDLELVIGMLRLPAHEATFRQRFVAALESRDLLPFEEADSVALCWWIGLSAQWPAWLAAGGLRGDVLRLYSQRIARLPKAERDTVLASVSRSCSLHGFGDRWPEVFEMVQRAIPSGVDRLLAWIRA